MPADARTVRRPIARGTVTRLTVLLAMVAAVALAPAVPAVGTPPDTALVRLTVDGWSPGPEAGGTDGGGSHTHGTGAAGTDRAAASGYWRVSSELRVDHAVAVGADWGGSPDVTVEVRTRRSEVWSRWMRLELVDDHAPDPGTPEAARGDATASDPLWLGAHDALQVRHLGGGEGLDVELHAVTVSGGDGLAFRPAAAGLRGSVAHAAPAEPSIITREEWGADESIRRGEPYYADELRFSVVHHTAGRNDYPCHESDDIVRAIYHYHVVTRGWDDIAYNFLVDRCGQVFEGRSGGILEPVVGAHAAGWNGGSTGVSVLGNFDTGEPPQAAVDALDALLAWKLDHHHVDPFGTTEELAGGGGSNRFERGELLVLPTIIGHRVTNSTSCPGEGLIDHIVQEHPEHPYDEPTARWEPVAAHRVEPIGLPKAYGGPPLEREQAVTGIRPRWDVDLTGPVDWRLTVRDADGALVRSTGGHDAESVDLAWDMRDADGEYVTPGSYTTELSAWSSTSRATPVTTAFEVTAPATRIKGTDRIATALELSRWAFDESDEVVLATAGTYADALAATPLAGSFHAPVLLVPSDHLPEAVAEEIVRLGVVDAWIVGGTAAVSDDVARALVDAVGLEPDNVQRLSGRDRFATSVAVADHIVDREGSTEVLVAVGAHEDETRAFPDALAAGALGAQFDLPLVLVTRDVLPPSTHEFLAGHRWPNGLHVFGGTAAVSASVEAAMAEATGAPVTRFSGGDRYDTARMAAEETLRRWAAWAEEFGPNPYLEETGLEIVTASGTNWPDALGAGAAADERKRSIFLTVPPDGIAEGNPTSRFVHDHASEVTHAVLAGGEAAVGAQTESDLRDLVLLDGPHTAEPEVWPEDPHAPLELPLPGPTSSPSPEEPDSSPSPAS